MVHKNKPSSETRDKRKFVDDKYFQPYTQPKMIEAAKELLCREDISEEAFLGAQAVLMLNGLI